MDIWHSALGNGHITKVEAVQSVIFRRIINVFWYSRKMYAKKVRKKVKIVSVWEEIQRRSHRYEMRTENHQTS